VKTNGETKTEMFVIADISRGSTRVADELALKDERLPPVILHREFDKNPLAAPRNDAARVSLGVSMPSGMTAPLEANGPHTESEMANGNEVPSLLKFTIPYPRTRSATDYMRQPLLQALGMSLCICSCYLPNLKPDKCRIGSDELLYQEDFVNRLDQFLTERVGHRVPFGQVLRRRASPNVTLHGNWRTTGRIFLFR
jgi:hypothetical protein